MSAGDFDPVQITGDGALANETLTVSGDSFDDYAPVPVPSGPAYRQVNLPDIELEDLSPAFRNLVGGNVMLAKQMIAFSPDDIREDLERAALVKLRAVKDEPGRLGITGGLNAAAAGMNDAEFNYWAERDLPYVENTIDDREILRQSGPDGYVTQAMMARELSRREARALAAVEAEILGMYEDGITGSFKRAWYDTRVGFGQVGAFAIKGMAGVARGVNDFVKDTEEGKKRDWRGLPYGESLKGVQQWLEDSSGFAAEWWNEKRLDAEAEWLGPAIDTGNPVTDYVRGAVFRTTPFMTGSMTLAAIPGVGTGGAAVIIAGGVGSDTYGTLRADGISPGLSLAAATTTGVASYFSTKFQLDNLTRYYRGFSPIKLFSVATAGEILAESGQEAVENIAQTTSEGLARLIGDPEYTSAKFWNDIKAGYSEALDEGASVGITTGAMRLFGFPIAARNQVRANAFAKSFTRTAESVAKTEMFKDNPDVLAGHLTNMAWRHGDGRVFTTVDILNQAGIDKDAAVKPIAEGGLGIDAAVYDEAEASGGIVSVGYGQAVVFGQKQAEAGNKVAIGAFMSDPESMSVGDIAQQRAEAEAIITQAEVYYHEEVKGDAPKTPLRLKIFKAGLRASGRFDAHQAAALTAIYRAGAERNAELAGETLEQWLERKNVRLEFEKTLLGTGSREANRYVELLREMDGELIAPMADAVAGTDTAMEAAQAGTSGEIMRQPAVGDSDNQAWIDEATENIVNAMGLRGEQFAPLAAAIRAAVEQGINNPDIRAIAKQLGIQIPEAVIHPASEDAAQPEEKITADSIRAGDRALERDAAAWQGVVDNFIGGRLDTRTPVTMMGQTPLVMQMLGAKNLPVRTSYNILKKILVDKHKLPAETVKQIPAALADPIMVFRSATHGGDLVVMLDLKDPNGATVIVPIGLEQTDKGGYSVNFVFSAYGKRHEGTNSPSDQWFADQARQGMLLYRNMKKSRDWARAARLQLPGNNVSNRDNNTIRTESDLVKLRNKNPTLYQSAVEALYQPESNADASLSDKPANRGSITFTPDSAIIHLFKGADVSTVVHELNHLFIRDLIGLVKAGKGGEKGKAHLAAMDAFAGGNLLSSDPDKRKAGYEKIAQAWERYAMDGIAPSNALAEPFSIIRQYMAATYRNVRETGLVEPSPEIRNVFDRMLATDRQIEDAARTRELKEDWTKAGKSGERVKRRMDAINARRDDRKRKNMDAAKGAGRALRNESGLDARRRTAREELSKEPAYKAIAIAKAKGGMNRPNAVAAVGEAAVLKIEQRHGDGIFAKNEADGVSMGEVAAMAGYSFDTIAEMLSAMAEAEALDARADSDARTQQSIDDLAEDVEREAQDEAEGVDDDADDLMAGPGEMTERQEADADEQDMTEEVELAIEDELADGGDASPARQLADRLREWRNQMAALRRAAYEKVFAMPLLEAADVRGFRASRNAARRKAMDAALAGKRDKVTALKKQEMYHFYEIQAAKQARKLRQRLVGAYGSRALQSAIDDSGEHKAKIKYEYAQALAEMAIYAGLGDSRFLRDLAGDRVGAAELILPQESDELEGLVPNIADTLDDWLAFKERPENFRDFRNFTVNQLMEIDRVMRWLMDNGRGKLAYIQEKDIQNLDDLIRQSVEPMRRRISRESKIDNDARTAKGRTLNRVKQFIISLTIPENWFMAMDGNPTIQGKAAGVNQRLLFETMLKANVARDMLYRDVIARLKPNFDVLNGVKKRLKKQFGGRLFTVEGLPVPEILKRGRNIASWDADLLISIALQMGNDANLRRLLTDADFDARFGTKVESEGGQDMAASRYNFTNAQLEIVAALFADAEWDAIQGLWDGINSLYGEADAVTFALTDRHVKKEGAALIMVRTADGKTKRLKGGYFPLVNDPMLSDRAAQLKEGQSIDEYIRSGTLGNVYDAAKRKVGALKSRARDEQGVPIVTLPQILSTNVIVQHIDAMAHYITHAKPLRDIDRMTRSQEWRDIYIAAFGQEQYDAIRKWVKNLSMPERGDASAGGRFMEHMRSLATINALGLRWKTGLKQRLGAFQAAAYMGDAAGSFFAGWKYLTQGVNELGVRGNIGFRNAKIDEVNSKSDYMAARSGGFDREMRAMRDKLSPLDGEVMGRSLGDWQNMAFFWIQANDQAMAYAVWLGAYKQAMAGDAGFSIAAKEGESEAEAVKRIEREAVAFADRAARTQASSFAADLTEIQRDRGFMRFMSMFMSGNVRQGSRLMQYIDAYRMGDKTKGDVAMLAVREFAFPALAWTFMAAAVKFAMSAALGMDDDDDESLLAEAFWETADTTVAPFPLLREAPRVMRYGALGGDVPAVKSTAQAANNLFSVPGRIAEARYMLAVGQAMRSAGYVFGIPVMNPLDDFFGFSTSEALGLKIKKGK